MQTNKTKFSQITTGDRKSSEYGTPLSLFDKLNSIFNFELDPCALQTEPDRLNLPYSYTNVVDGLKQEWGFNTFINPPFGTKKGENVRAWINKMQESSEKYPYNFYVMLLPARIESNWFQEEIFSDRKGCIYAISGRLKFYNPVLNKNADPHPIGSVLYIRALKFRVEDIATELEESVRGLFIRSKVYH